MVISKPSLCRLLFLTVFCVYLQAEARAPRRRKPQNQWGVKKEFALSSPAFSNGGEIPVMYTCDSGKEGRREEQAGVSPPLQWGDPPAGTESFVIMCVDPDALGRSWVHWIVFNLPVRVRRLEAGQRISLLGGMEGKNSWGDVGYGGPCPPLKKHRYIFTIYAVNKPLKLSSDAKLPDLKRAMQGRVLAKVKLVGRYQRPKNR